MRIDSTSAQPQRVNDLLSQQQTKQVAGQGQLNADNENKTTKTAMMQPPTQNNAQGVGTKVDFFA